MPPPVGTNGVIRVMVVDDSAVARGMLSRVIETDPELQVIALASDGIMAVDALKKSPVDVIILDLEMPKMDGMTALPKLLEVMPEVKIIISSNITRQNAELAFKAIHAGAKDYLSKPSTSSEMSSVVAYRRDLIGKIRALAGPKRVARVDEARLDIALRLPSLALPAFKKEVKPIVIRPCRSGTNCRRRLRLAPRRAGPRRSFRCCTNFPAN